MEQEYFYAMALTRLTNFNFQQALELYRAVGSAQRIYVKRGFIPDGSGVWYQGKQCVQYETNCTVDDDLILYFSKKLRG